jgi:KDO transferase-3
MNSNISDFKFKYLDKSVFVVASGPSANDFPFDKYKDALYIGMNGSIYKLAEKKIKPVLYLCDDPGFPNSRMDAIKLAVEQSEAVAFSQDVIDVILRSDANLLNGKNIYLMKKVNRMGSTKELSDKKFAWNIRNDSDFVSNFSFFSAKKCSIGFSFNLEKGYFVARTIPYVALQFAHYMGFSKAYLIGVDLNQEQGRFYEQGENALQSSLNEHYARNILPSFKLVADRVIKRGVFEIYNLSAESRLPADVIPKINYQELGSIYSLE